MYSRFPIATLMGIALQRNEAHCSHYMLWFIYLISAGGGPMNLWCKIMIEIITNAISVKTSL